MKSWHQFAASLMVLSSSLLLVSCDDDDDNNNDNAAIGLQIIGQDLNNTNNAFVQPQDNALAGNGRDQTQQFGDILMGDEGDDVIAGGLGTDVIRGKGGDDIILGGTEDFNGFNRDRAFGDEGNDAFMWMPGDGSDFFDGGHGNQDTVMLGLVGEDNGTGSPLFQVQNDQNFDPLFFDPVTHTPIMDVTNSPGFCTVIDHSTSVEAAQELDALGLTHLVRFTIRGVADAFERGDQDTDNGLRVTLHLKGVEYLVCATRAGGAIEVLDLSTQPPTAVSVDNLTDRIRATIR